MEKKELWKRINEAPENIQEAVSSFETSNTVEEIATYHNLKQEQRIQLSKEVTLYLLGVTKKTSLPSSLEKYLVIPNYQAQKIAIEIDQKILSKVKKTENTVPINLPVQAEGEEIPTFSDSEKVTSKSQYPISKPNETPSIKVQSKPQYQHPQSTPPTRGLSQSEIIENRPKSKPYVPPTRDFSYRDEKIGGVNIQKEESAEIDENINREDLLKDIENPTKSEPSGGNLRQSSYKGTDPYREPLE